MALRQILTEPNKILREKSLPVETVDVDMQKLMDDMLETMYAAPGIGLAAIQIGVPKRVIVLDIDQKEGQKKPLFFVNPEIIKKSKNLSTYEEGCLSVPGELGEVTRSAKVTMKYMDLDGQEHTVDADGLKAVALQHECDHLDGKLFVDYLSRLKRNVIRRRMNKLKAERATGT